MKDRIKTLKKRYEGLKFRIEYPVLDIGGGDGKFLETQEVENALIIDMTYNQNPKYKYIKTDISKEFQNKLFNKNSR